MQRLVIILLLIFEVPIISNAAGINDDSFMNHKNKKNEEVENIKTNPMHVFNDSFDKAESEYNIELLSILKKNKIIQKIQDKPLNYQQYQLHDTGGSDFIKVILNDEIDVPILLETESVWEEIKGGLNYKNIIIDKVDAWTQDILDKYYDEKIDTNFLLVSDVNFIKQSNNKNNSYKPTNMLSSIIYQGDTHRIQKNDDNQNILSVIYLWKKYSDFIVGALIIALLWQGIAILMKFLMKTSLEKY